MRGGTVAVIVAAVLAGCGGSAKTGTEVRDCLLNQPALETPSSEKSDLDMIAQNVDGTALAMASKTGNDITVIVEPNADKAKIVERTYRGFGDAFGGTIKRDANVVVAYLDATDAEVSAVNDCV